MAEPKILMFQILAGKRHVVSTCLWNIT